MQAQTYNITDNVNLRVNALTIQGHIVFEVNSMVLNYHGTEYTMRDESFKRFFTNRVFFSIKSIELANYLARLIYGVNLFDIYRNQVEDEHTVNELDSYVFRGENNLERTFQVNTTHEYIDNLMRDNGHPSDEFLQQHRNPRFPSIVRTVEEITEAPIFIRVQANLNNTAPNVRSFMHGCLAFNILAHQDRFADFNTQAAIGFFNTTIRTNDLGLTTEQMNIGDYRELLRAKDATIRELRENMRTVIAQNNQLLADNRETHHQLDETHRLLNNANHKLDNIGHQINSLSETFTNNFSEMNMTTGTAEYTYIVLSIPSLTREMISNQSIPSNYAVFDSICCLKKDRQKQLASHYFNPDTDVIELEYECSCSLDISKFITTNFSKAYCYNFNSSDYRRKIVYATSRKDNIIEKIRKYLARSEQNKFSIIERLDRLQETVNNIETRVSSIEDFFMYLRHKGTFIIDGKTIRRVLNRDLYHNLYINLDGSRHTLTLDELNNATFE